MISRTKLIEVALPLEAINIASAREKSIRHGHPSTLHLWWARRPLAACRAVLFTQLVDDPSAWPEIFPTEEAQETERLRLFEIIEQLVLWENSTNEDVLLEARREIARSVARGAGIGEPETAEEVWKVLREHAPPVLDPFCGGGSIPLEAQRLGLEAHASDLNPVAVLITKALIEIPPKFAGMPPINPKDRERGMGAGWKGAAGLTADVRYYGEWMREEARKRIGHLYPKVKLPEGGHATVIAWLWARTITCPNPACGARMPLVRSFALSKKKGKETWVEPVVNREAKTVDFEVRNGQGIVPEGTVNRGGATCIVCGMPAAFSHVRAAGMAGEMSQRLMAVVAEGTRERKYLSPTDIQLVAPAQAKPKWAPEAELPNNTRDIRPQLYGLSTYGDLFTPRQLVALITFSDLVGETRQLVLADCLGGVLPDDGVPLEEGGRDATARADAVATYLSFAVSRSAGFWCSLAFWSSHVKDELVKGAFGRQALPMTWDFGEVNPFGRSGGSFITNLEYPLMALDALSALGPEGKANQVDAREMTGKCSVISTDPPYYDNIGYADLSDFFYSWLRYSLRTVYPALFRTILVPKSAELIAAPYRFGGDKRRAGDFFEEGLQRAFARMREVQEASLPLALFYAFKQTETEHAESDIASSGWETILSGLVSAGFEVTGTWPMRTELTAALKKSVAALASSVVLVCRPRRADALIATRRELIGALREELPPAVRHLTRGNIAPVDLAQAAIGPGMRVFSRYAKVMEANGDSMRVRDALGLINTILYEVETETENEYDPDTRWAITWFEQFGAGEGPYGDAETLSKAKDTSVAGLRESGIVHSQGGKVRLLRRDELPTNWDPVTDQRLTVWEVTQHLSHALDMGGEASAADLLRRVGGLGEAARALAYALYLVADRKKRTDDALAYNGLVIAWPEITRLAGGASGPAQGTLGV
jgi:putative DNA methylase